MTVKRYVAILETASYKDTATNEVLCPKHEKDYYTVLDRLNRYDEDCKMYRNDALKAEKDKEHLLEENEQLKQKLELYGEIYPTGKWITKLNSEELKKELEE